MIYALFPIFAAICYALAYIFDEKALEKVNVATLMLSITGIGLPLSLAAVFILAKTKGESVDFSFLSDSKLLAYIVFGALLGTLGFLFTLFAIQKTSASYTAFAEISYPLFTVLFLFLFFGARHFDWSLLLGGGLVLLGSIVLIYGQMRQIS